MSRIGKLPIGIPEGVTVSAGSEVIEVSGPKGSLKQAIVPGIKVSIEGKNVLVQRIKGDKKTKALHGLYRSLINNMIYGVDKGWSKTLELTGVGYKAQLIADDLALSLGFSHVVKFKKPQGITFTILEKEGRIIVSGFDKQLIGETAAKIRRLRPPEPYKGKGIHYLGEKLKTKVGKSAKTIGTTTK
ncbi:50S ribosomal protein L6 [Candidatus Gottesmanbacteria bacterium]|nr:50S ribosomal protein L6 [Candidatus Gottesmanbacteria bacterium]